MISKEFLLSFFPHHAKFEFQNMKTSNRILVRSKAHQIQVPPTTLYSNKQIDLLLHKKIVAIVT
jgi:hypothetical protein